MLQAIIIKPGEIRFEDVPKPSLKKGEVLIKVRNIGICGSDIHVFHGEHIYKSYPMIQGHEMSGKVVEVAKDVSNIKREESYLKISGYLWKVLQLQRGKLSHL